MFRKIKALLRNTIYQTTVHTRIDKLEQKLLEANKKLMEANKDVRKIIARDVAGNHRLYDCDRMPEKRYIHSFNDFIKTSDYKELFVNLTRGLDDNSISLIVNILKRFEIVDGKEGTIGLYSKEEHKRLQDSADRKAHILKVSDDLYCMNEYRLPIDRFSVDSYLFIDRYGINNINYSTFDNKDIIDAGAFIGDSLLIFHKLTSGKIYSFEPLSANYDLLLKTIELNSIVNCVPIKMGLGVGETKQPFVYDSTCSKQVMDVLNTDQELEYVEMTSIDAFVERNGNCSVSAK